ncbi:MAG: DUF481 domain-containing protein [Bdellovibrionales bacterium]|nr:DUF481 domain-containing protein [Bdellovibrionales bacterium]
MKSLASALLVFFLSTAAQSQVTNETEVSIVALGGNAESTTYSGKQATSYTMELNKVALAGRYQQVFASSPNAALTRVSQETARNWLVSLRYERELSTAFSLYGQQTAESDIFAGYNQRYNSDLGGKYSILKDDATDWSSELGYRYTAEFRTIPTAKFPNTDVRQHFARVYTKATHKLSEGVSTELWLEYLPNFTNTEDWMSNGEMSLTSQLSSMFSLKTAYQVRYRNTLVGAARSLSDHSFTTAIVAKY